MLAIRSRLALGCLGSSGVVDGRNPESGVSGNSEFFWSPRIPWPVEDHPERVTSLLDLSGPCKLSMFPLTDRPEAVGGRSEVLQIGINQDAIAHH